MPRRSNIRSCSGHRERGRRGNREQAYGSCLAGNGAYALSACAHETEKNGGGSAPKPDRPIVFVWADLYGQKKRVATSVANPLKYLVRPERFELPTYWFVASCSIQLSHGRITETSFRRHADKGQAFFAGIFKFFLEKPGGVALSHICALRHSFYLDRRIIVA